MLAIIHSASLLLYKKSAGLFILLHTYKINRIADVMLVPASTYPQLSIAESKKDNSNGLTKDSGRKDASSENGQQRLAEDGVFLI